jgi:hypothetical protein
LTPPAFYNGLKHRRSEEEKSPQSKIYFDTIYKFVIPDMVASTLKKVELEK